MVMDTAVTIDAFQTSLLLSVVYLLTLLETLIWENWNPANIIAKFSEKGHKKSPKLDKKLMEAYLSKKEGWRKYSELFALGLTERTPNYYLI